MRRSIFRSIDFKGVSLPPGHRLLGGGYKEERSAAVEREKKEIPRGIPGRAATRAPGSALRTLRGYYVFPRIFQLDFVRYSDILRGTATAEASSPRSPSVHLGVVLARRPAGSFPLP